jgi:LacI family transcriptional regulator
LGSNEPPVIVGLDDFDLADALGISVIDRCPAELGRQAALLAMQRITEPDSPLTHLLLPPQFVRRANL